MDEWAEYKKALQEQHSNSITQKLKIKQQAQLLQRCKPFVEQAYQQASDANLGYTTFMGQDHERYMQIMKECKEILEEMK